MSENQFKFELGQVVYWVESVGIGENMYECHKQVVRSGQIINRRLNKRKPPIYYIKGKRGMGIHQPRLFAFVEDAQRIADNRNFQLRKEYNKEKRNESIGD